MAVDAFGFDVKRQETARRLHSARLRVFAARVVVYGAIMAILVAGASRTLAAWADASGGPVGSAVPYIAVLYGAFFGINFPFAAYSGLVLERRYGLSRETGRSWLLREVKGSALGLAFSLPAVLVLLHLLRILPDLWWAVAWVFSTAVSLLFAFAAPTLIAPLFYKFEPIQDSETRERLETLSRRARLRVTGVYTMNASIRTNRSNAAVIGLGPTRRIVIADNLLASFDPDESETVVAHELAHVAHRDTIRFQLFAGAASLVTLASAGLLFPIVASGLGYRIQDLSALPLLGVLLAAASAIVAPALNFVSRRAESRADDFAVSITGKRAAFARALVKLHDANLGVANPSRAFEVVLMSHPSGHRRVRRLGTTSKAVI